MSHRALLRLLAVACAAAFVLIPTASALAAGDPNAGDVWVDNVGQPAGPGNEMDPHLACQNINLWGDDVADSSGTYTIDGWPPSGLQEQDYASTWSYNQSTGGAQVMDVISVSTLIDNAIANADAPVNGQGFHFKLQFSADPQKHKTFWVNCQVPTITTNAASATAGQAIHDVATLSGGDSPTGTIVWNVYLASDMTCSTSLGTVQDTVNGDGTYTSPNFMPPSIGGYQWVASYSGDSQNLPASTACNDPNEQSIVTKVSPSIATTASSSTIGGSVNDQAVLSGGDSPTGPITWSVYVAGSGCVTPLMTTTPVSVNGDGSYASPSYTPSATGTYEWVATYSGDANNNPLSSSCTDPAEQSVVSPASPAMSTTASPTATLGQSIGDTATLSGGTAPTGSITWSVYAAGTNCATALFTSTPVSVNGDGSYASPTYTPTAAGTYQWVASYSGDANNGPFTSACDVTSEQSVVSPASPSLSTTASPTATLGQSIGDTAVLSGGAAPTGTITWKVYAAGTSCTTALFTTAPVSVNGDGSYASPSVTPSAAGTYQWVASYSGDANNNAFTSACNVTSEQSVVNSPPSPPPTPPAPGISVIKLQRDGSTGPFTAQTITVKVGDTIDYEIQSTNTGNTTLALTLSDQLCNPGTIEGPFDVSGTLVGNVLSPGGVAQFTCSHVLLASDPSPFTNTATITGQPPSGPPVDGTASVTADKAAVSPIKIMRCAHGKVKKHKKVHGKTVTVCVKKHVKAAVHKRIPLPRFTG